MTYGKSWEKFPIEKNEIWSCGNSKIMVNDITEYLPDYMITADMIYSDTPWTLGNVNMFNGKEGRSYMNHFSEFYEPLFSHIKKINPNVCYLEIGKQEFSLFKKRLSNIFEHIDFWEITYYGDKPCYLLRGGKVASSFNFTGLDDVDTPLAAITIETPKVVADFCTGRGLTGVAALNCGCDFVGTELQKRKLAIFIERAKKIGYVFTKE